jgi:hypothetical protein
LFAREVTAMTERQTRHLKSAFLEAFRECGNISRACRDIGMTNRTEVYKWQERDDQFAAAFRDAEVEAVDALEAEARRRAIGYEQVIVDKDGGEHVTTRYSDVLLIFLLKGARPERYRERVDVTTTTAPTVKAFGGFDPSEV